MKNKGKNDFMQQRSRIEITTGDRGKPVTIEKS